MSASGFGRHLRAVELHCAPSVAFRRDSCVGCPYTNGPVLAASVPRRDRPSGRLLRTRNRPAVRFPHALVQRLCEWMFSWVDSVTSCGLSNACRTWSAGPGQNGKTYCLPIRSISALRIKPLLAMTNDALIHSISFSGLSIRPIASPMFGSCAFAPSRPPIQESAICCSVTAASMRRSLDRLRFLIEASEQE